LNSEELLRKNIGYIQTLQTLAARLAEVPQSPVGLHETPAQENFRNKLSNKDARTKYGKVS